MYQYSCDKNITIFIAFKAGDRVWICLINWCCWRCVDSDKFVPYCAWATDSYAYCRPLAHPAL